MTAYTRWYGAYRAPELDIVLWDGPGGMEWPELLMSRSGSIAHEVAHQWWYGIVGNDQYTEPWLDEAFATYSQKRLDDGEAYGAATCVKGNPLEAYGNASLRDSMARFDRYTSQYDAIYSGGACALWQLAAATGAGWFDGFAQALVTTYAGDVLTTDDLIATLRARAPVGFDVDRYLAEARLVDPPRRDLITFRPDVLAPTRRAARGSTLFATTMTGAAPATVTIETGSARFRTSAFTGPAGRLVGRLLVDARLADQMPVDAAVRTGPCAPGRGTWHVVITAPSAGCMPISAVRTAARVTLTLDLTAIMALEAHGVTLRLDDTAMTRPGRRARAITTRIAVAPCVPGTGPTACTAAGPAASRFVLETIGGTTGVTLQRTRLRAGRATVVGRVLRAGKPVAATVDICVRARGATGGCGVYAATIEVSRKSFRFVFRRSSAVVVTVQAHSPLAPEALRRQATLLGSLRA